MSASIDTAFLLYLDTTLIGPQQLQACRAKSYATTRGTEMGIDNNNMRAVIMRGLDYGGEHKKEECRKPYSVLQ